MKKIIIIMLILLSGCNVKEEEKIMENNKNACSISDNCETDKKAIYDELISTNTFEVFSLRDLINSINNEDTLIAYLGFKTCPWCQEIIPYLKDMADSEKIKIKYVNIRPEGETKEFDIRTEDNQDYVELREILKDKLDEGRISVPFIAIIKKGEVVSYNYGTVPSHDAHEREMNEEEVKKLEQKLKEMFDIYKN